MGVTIRVSGSLIKHVMRRTRAQGVRRVSDAVSQLGLSGDSRLTILIKGCLQRWHSEPRGDDAVYLIALVAGRWKQLRKSSEARQI